MDIYIYISTWKAPSAGSRLARISLCTSLSWGDRIWAPLSQYTCTQTILERIGKESFIYAERQSTRGRDRERDKESERERQTRGSILWKNPAVTKRETRAAHILRKRQRERQRKRQRERQRKRQSERQSETKREKQGVRKADRHGAVHILRK